MRTRWSSSSHRASPGLTANASWNSLRLRTALPRTSWGECGSMASSRMASASRALPFQTWAQPMKKRCGPVKPSSLGHAALLGGDAVGGVADLQAAEVADVLADGQTAVDLVVVGQPGRRVAAELLDEPLRQRVEPLAVGLGPPVAQGPGAVVARALVVEAVAQARAR